MLFIPMEVLKVQCSGRRRASLILQIQNDLMDFDGRRNIVLSVIFLNILLCWVWNWTVNWLFYCPGICVSDFPSCHLVFLDFFLSSIPHTEQPDFHV